MNTLQKELSDNPRSGHTSSTELALDTVATQLKKNLAEKRYVSVDVWSNTAEFWLRSLNNHVHSDSFQESVAHQIAIVVNFAIKKILLMEDLASLPPLVKVIESIAKKVARDKSN